MDPKISGTLRCSLAPKHAFPTETDEDLKWASELSHRLIIALRNAKTSKVSTSARTAAASKADDLLKKLLDALGSLPLEKTETVLRRVTAPTLQ